MKRNVTKMMCAAFLPFALALLVPKMASATPVTVNPGQVVALSSLMTAGDVVLCDPGVAVCSASTPRADIEGVGSFYLSFLGPLTPDTGPDANTVTFLTAALLTNFLNNYPGGFSSNAVFLTASANGMTPFGNFIFNDSGTGTSPTPEPSTLTLMGLGLLGVAALFRRQAAAA
ncbi:MAG: PEP-CTERM sorting domain-containing protein [Candidatus Acidiferrales bacterium]